MNFLYGNIHSGRPKNHHTINEEYFYADKKKIGEQVDAILSGAHTPNYHFVNKSRTISLQQLDFILQVPALRDFYNFFFVDEYDITYEEDMKRFIHLYGKLTGDIDKLYIFSHIVMDYFLHKISSEIMKLGQLYDIEYQKKVTPKINELYMLQDEIQRMKNQLDEMYDIPDKNSVDSKYFTQLILEGNIQGAYNYAQSKIKNELEEYQSMYRIFYGKDIPIDKETLPGYKIWSKQIQKIKKQFPPILYES